MKINDIANKIGLFTLPIIGGWLGAFGGADKTSKNWRRILIPGLITSYAYGNTESLLTVTIISMCGALSIGYGLPASDYLTNPAVDKGSDLGRFYYRLFKANKLWADMFTRGTVGLLISISLISLPIINHNWIIYALCSLGIVLTNALISWRNLKSYKLFNKELTWSETITWGLITLFSCLIIFIK